MKTHKSKFLALIALGGLVAFGPLAQAETTGAKSARSNARRAGAAQNRLQNIAEQLQLTADQKEKLKPIFDDETQKLRALRQDTSLSREDRTAKLKAIQEATDAKVKPLLTTEQLEKWNKLRAEAPKRPRKEQTKKS